MARNVLDRGVDETVETAMDNTAYLALARALSVERRLDVIANNIANVDTPGFRAELERAGSVPWRGRDGERVTFVQDLGRLFDPSEGPLRRTGNPLDLAIRGDGWFTVMTADGPAYTRAGHFERDPTGRIVTSEGYALLDENGSPIEIPPGSGRIEVAADGTLSTEEGPIARIRPVTFADPRVLRRAGDGLFVTDEVPVPAEDAVLVQGMVEGSNVRPVVELTRMIEVQRSYERALQLISTHYELERRTTERTLARS